MKIGKNAPQIFQYAVNLFNGEPSEMVEEDNFKYGPIDVQKVLERERSKIEVAAGQFIYSGFTLWTPQQLDESLLFSSRHMGSKITLKIDHESEFVVNTADIDNPDR